MKYRVLLAAAAAAVPSVAAAHPGHVTSAGWLHYLSEPYHFSAAAAAVGCGIAMLCALAFVGVRAFVASRALPEN